MKNKFILCGKHGRPSTKLVYSKMTSGKLMQRRQIFRGRGASRSFLRQYYRLFQNNNSEVLTKAPEATLENSVVIRWGTREELPSDSSSVVYNTAASIARITDKYQSRRCFAENNVATPKDITLQNVAPEDYPIICRPFVHSKGRNFIVLNDEVELRAHYNTNRFYYSAFVDKTREFRIHVGHSKVLAVMEKNPVEGSIAWNRAIDGAEPFNYITWTQVDEQNLKPVLVEAIKAVLAVGADMGGVDVLLTADNQPSVVEVNSAPTLNSSDYVAGRWADYFSWLFKEETRRDHWDYAQFERGSSLIWKNYQLRDETRS